MNHKPVTRKTGLVTALADIGRGTIDTAFNRTFDQYVHSFFEWLRVDCPLIIHAPRSLHDEILRIREERETKLFPLDVEILRTGFPYSKQTEAVRTNPKWFNGADWLKDSPQAALTFYNPLVLNKMYWLKEAAESSFFDCTDWYWIDAGISNTLHPGYLYHDPCVANLGNLPIGFHLLTFPYHGNSEIHGFERQALADYCETPYVKRVARGGFFGGDVDSVKTMANRYDHWLHHTLTHGYMGTEECILTLLSYRYFDELHCYNIGDDGLIFPFFEALKDNTTQKLKLHQREADRALPERIKASTYILSFNFPEQLRLLLESFRAADPYLLNETRLILINNSDKTDVFEAYAALCEEFGMEEIRTGNLGICGGRQFAAEHFQQSDSEYMFFFEDDMCLYPPGSGVCRNGFPCHIPELTKKSLMLMREENPDILKLSFTEFFGDHYTQWAWFNVPQEVRQSAFPNHPELPDYAEPGDAPSAIFNGFESTHGLAFAYGEIYYSNWPQLLGKTGNQKLFLETVWEYPYEQTWMSHIFQLTRENRIRPAVLLASPVNHNRVFHYAAEERKENNPARLRQQLKSG